MGTKRRGVRATSDSSIQIEFPYQGERCRERLRLEPTKTNLDYAARLRGEILNEIERGTFDYSKRFSTSRKAKKLSPGAAMDIGDALQAFLSRIEREVARSTFIDWRRSVENILIHEFGHLKLSELRKSHVKEWIGGHNLTQKRTCNILTPLRRVMEDALEDEVIETNPLSDLKVKKRKVDHMLKLEDKIDPFDDEEIQAILPHLHPQAQNYVIVAVWTGLRVEELIELQWKDIDFQKGEIRVRRARTRGETKAPKTAAGTRDITLLEPARAALVAQKAYTLLQKEHVFHDPRTGAPYDTDRGFREWQWRKALPKANVRYRYPQQLRHTYASWMLGAGELPQWVKEQMGHESLVLTLDTYARWIPKADPEAGSKAVGKWSTHVEKANQ